MQRLRKNIIRIFVGIFGLVPAISFSCTCADPGPASEDAVIEALCAVDVVFIGRAGASTMRSDDGMEFEIEPIQVLKGEVTRPLVAEIYTTCDSLYSQDVDYLIFGRIEKGSNTLSTSNCGHSRFTRKLKYAEFQHRIVEENIARIDELCSESVSTERRLRILKERRNLSDLKYDQLLEDTRATQDEGK